jgi:hypothetical protein
MKAKFILLSALLTVFGNVSKAVSTTDLKQKLVSIVCKYDETVTRKRNPYSACFETNAECLQSPIWVFKENSSTYFITGAFGYSCHFDVDKQTGTVVKFVLTDPGE